MWIFSLSLWYYLKTYIKWLEHQNSSGKNADLNHELTICLVLKWDKNNYFKIKPVNWVAIVNIQHFRKYLWFRNTIPIRDTDICNESFFSTPTICQKYCMCARGFTFGCISLLNGYQNGKIMYPSSFSQTSQNWFIDSALKDAVLGPWSLCKHSFFITIADDIARAKFSLKLLHVFCCTSL